MAAGQAQTLRDETGIPSSQALLDYINSLGPSVVLPVVLGARSYLAVFELYEEWVGQRVSAEAGAVLDRDCVAALWDLPIGGRVSIGALRPGHTELLRRLPHGLIRFHGDSVERQCGPPLRIEALVACRASGAAALASFGGCWWAPIEIAASSASVGKTLVQRAAGYEIGLLAGEEWLVAPQRKLPKVPTYLGAWQAELVFDQWLKFQDLAIA